MFDLSGKVAVVTGGNGGIGLGMARGLGGAGAAVVIAARNVEKSRAAVRDLETRGASAFAVETDVTDEKSVAAMVEATLARCGRLDILVNNAGTNIRRPAHELGTADWHKVLDTNLTSAFLCSKAVHPAMKRNGAGKIISIGSMMSIFGASFAPAYAASKAGIVQLTNDLGEVDLTAFSALTQALNSGLAADFEAIPLGGTTKLANPQASYCYSLEGADAEAISIPPAPAFASARAKIWPRPRLVPVTMATWPVRSKSSLLMPSSRE